MIPVYPDSHLIPSLRALWKCSFGDEDPFLDDFFATGYDPRRCRCVVLDDRAAAALYWFDVRYQDRTYAYLYAVATHPDYRRKGLIHYLLADTHQLLARQGYAGALLVPADSGLRQMYRAIGYETCTGVSQFVSASLAREVSMHPIDREEYQRLRREFLPKDGVLQEGPALDFLSTFAKFYTGQGFLLCCAPKSPELLNGIEFLGDPDTAPGILCALGYSHGVFQTPGDKLPFAMLYKLQKDCPVPGYFGLDLS